MNRDAIIATVIGFGIGLLITGMFLVGPGIVRSLPPLSFSFPKIQLPNTKPKLTPSPSPTHQERLTIDSPLPNSVETNPRMLVSGNSPTDSLVVIEGVHEEIVVSANGDGKYAGTVSLAEGKNDIVVTSYTNGKPTRQSVTVFYTQEKF